ncbi:MAG TPA: RluA family pseudouridine synthase [Polyangiaceae bacterium]|jgi:23S rRNA-/tRNA-specific pseudouridylate synthase
MSGRRWVVGAGDGETVGAIVGKAAPGDTKAIAEGRVFVGRKRVRSGDEPVTVGDAVTVAEPAEAVAWLTVLKRGRGWVAVDKPAGLPSIPDQGGAAHSLLALTARALSLPTERLHPTSRLDRDVSGVVIFAFESAAADRLRLAREEHRYARRYVAIAVRPPVPPSGTWDSPIGRGRDARHRAAFGKDPDPAKTHYATVAVTASPVLLALAPVTGRTHQLRVHASHEGAPFLGDRAYGGPTRLPLPTGRVLAFDRVFLHAARVTVDGAEIDSPVPEALRATWLALGGEGEAWEKAVSWPLPAS